ncbi:putative two-component system response regulator [Skermanella aerolata]|uniref:Two-component system response regulator n=1 Tax=Skermanella aerolata TaxID=393310 RepID=A0A512DRX9_9PROT|nr:HD domain-containing phosphohydrolase [Skermanella aerolata]GEO39242.1 two-component system response regulator [Skermanella aerolata]
MTDMTLLIVDDSPADRLLMSRYAEAVGDVHVRTASSAQEALTSCEEQGVDLVVTDFMMPGMDGMAFVSRLRSMPNMTDVPIVMVTTNADTGLRRDALLNGVMDFLSKPVDRIEFVARCRNLLALRASSIRLREEAASELIMRLSRSMDSRDSETGAHLERMARYAAVIAAAMGLSRQMQERIRMAAPMHDIGKVAVSDHILFKPGRYTDEEFEVMKQHTLHGYRILDDSASPLVRLAATIALSHHEKFDGSGYPQRLKGKDIPLAGRIVAIADVFDALTSARPYKEAWQVEEALDFLKANTGSHFDPDCMAAFFSSLPVILEIREEFRD